MNHITILTTATAALLIDLLELEIKRRQEEAEILDLWLDRAETDEEREAFGHLVRGNKALVTSATAALAELKRQPIIDGGRDPRYPLDATADYALITNRI